MLAGIALMGMFLLGFMTASCRAQEVTVQAELCNIVREEAWKVRQRLNRLQRNTDGRQALDKKLRQLHRQIKEMCPTK
jgi:hypothetical protein